MLIQQGMTVDDASALFIDLQHESSEPGWDWSFTDPAKMSKAVRNYGIRARKSFPDRFASVRRRAV
jgi:hypothetical protein